MTIPFLADWHCSISLKWLKIQCRNLILLLRCQVLGEPPAIRAVLSQEEVARLIDSAQNRVHRTMLMMLYATGLRRAELCHL